MGGNQTPNPAGVKQFVLKLSGAKCFFHTRLVGFFRPALLVFLATIDLVIAQNMMLCNVLLGGCKGCVPRVSGVVSRGGLAWSQVVVCDGFCGCF